MSAAKPGRRGSTFRWTSTSPQSPQSPQSPPSLALSAEWTCTFVCTRQLQGNLLKNTTISGHWLREHLCVPVPRDLQDVRRLTLRWFASTPTAKWTTHLHGRRVCNQPATSLHRLGHQYCHGGLARLVQLAGGPLCIKKG
jgi:hypothetical protein